MHLKTLTLRGFKSFASTTSLQLEPGITCVVGPNGSGKSNVVDALAWVMGEQGAKTLRGGTMEDVVFAGTAGRPPLGRAEVALTIDNTDGSLPIDFSEVTISRILFRNGGSEYAINGQACRLLDVQELLGDSGIGREMHVIVGQGQLDSILRATPADRRGFVEEAAGVLKHRKRKEKALRKLETTDANLTRLNDLLGEIRRQLKPLGRQAEVARRAALVQAAARDARARLLADDICGARETLARDVADESALRARRDEVEGALVQARRVDEECDQILRSVTPGLARAQETWYHLAGLRERVSGTAGLAVERVRRFEDEPHRPVNEADPGRLETEAAAMAAQEHQIRAEVAAARSALDAAVAEREAAERVAAEADQQVTIWARAQADHREGLAGLRGQLDAERARLRAAEDELERLAAARAQALTRTQRAQHDFTSLENTVAGLDAGERGLDVEHEAAELALADVSERLAKQREEAQRAEHDRAGLAARKDALALGLERRDGTGELLAAANRPAGLLGSAASLLRIRPGYETAVASALGSAADAMVAADVPTAIRVIGHLHEHDLGRAQMLLGGKPVDDRERAALPPGARYADEVVEAPQELSGAVGKLLRDVAVVADLDAAQALVRSLPQLVAVTRAGDVLGTHVAAGGSSGRPSRLELQAAHDDTVAGLAAAVATTQRLRFEVARLEEERADAQRRVDVALARLHESDAAMAAVAERLGQLGAAARTAQEELERIGSATEMATQAVESRRDAVGAAEQRLEQAAPQPGVEVDTARRDELVAASSSARQREVDARLALRTVEERAGAIAARVAELQASAQAERENRSRAASRRTQRVRERDRAVGVVEAARIVLARLDDSLDLARAERERLEARRREADSRAADVRALARALGAELDRLTDSVHRDEVARAEQRLRVEQLEQRSAEELGLEVEALLADYGPTVPVPSDEEPAAGEVTTAVTYLRAAQVERLRTAEREMALLGRINPLALEEYDALEERHAFLSHQLDDVRRTRADLLGIVADVDAHVLQVFVAAWQDTAREFATVFSRLFPGGEGRLVLTDPDDMLATGIEVEARPAGTAIKRLSLLSGGERSLVAVAFLIALFRARPSPFYILDEVEAALDDTNLGRLLEIYEELRTTSQLVVITHQKRTMEIADALYGVSMRGDGVSTVISQRLREPAPA